MQNKINAEVTGVLFFGLYGAVVKRKQKLKSCDDSKLSQSALQE